jgi:putative membrane protein
MSSRHLWMAACSIYPRLFVYHCEAEKGSKQSATFKVMERRLLKANINPAMIHLAGRLYSLGRATGSSAGFTPSCLVVIVRRPRLFFRWVKDFAADRIPEPEILSYYQEVPTC